MKGEEEWEETWRKKKGQKKMSDGEHKGKEGKKGEGKMGRVKGENDRIREVKRTGDQEV